MYLHNDKQLFEEVVSATANEISLPRQLYLSIPDEREHGHHRGIRTRAF